MATRQAALESAGERVGAQLGLGECTGAWTHGKYRFRVGCGSLILFLGIPFCWIPIVFDRHHLTAAEVVGGVLLVGAVMSFIPPRMWEHRLFRFEHGLALLDPQRKTTTVVRWDDLASLRMRISDGDEDHVTFCELGDRAGQAISLSSFGTAVSEIAGNAEKLLIDRLLPALIARYESGAPVYFGLFTVEQRGLSAPGGPSGLRWRISWPEVSYIDIGPLGHRLTVKDAAGSVHVVRPEGEPNDFLARHLIEHAARRARVDVTRPA
jgi:hypothetical protein